jgi:protein-S-isoprenylcysteine O-methyltransferase Ste14
MASANANSLTASAASRPLLAERVSRLRQTRGYDLAVRFLGSMWFLFLAAFIAHGLLRDGGAQGGIVPSQIGWMVLLSKLCMVAFYVTLWGLIVTRPPAKAQSDGLMPTVAAFAGTYMPWSISLFAATSHSTALNFLSAACLAAGMLLAVYTVLHLGRSFSLVPQARRVVQAGPYRWIKHPLYLSEELAVLGTVLQFFSLGTLMVLVIHVAIQIRRILYEEDLLRRTLPEYSAYEASRWRLVPYVW